MNGDRVARWAFPALFVVSGGAALVYQVVWSRMLSAVFGVTAFAVATVLVSFMGGMALGAAILGTRADRVARPLRMFALLEAGIGVYAVLMPWLLAGMDAALVALWPSLPESFVVRSAIRFVGSLALLIVPTMLMGATLPALGQGLLRRRESLGLGIGILYFVNTLGAAVGCFLAGFVLLPRWGLTATTFIAFAGNALVAAIAFALDRGVPAAPTVASDAPEVAETPATSPAWWPYAVTCGSGFAALAFEVVWFRVLVLVFGSTIYSFSAMLTVFLTGLAAGSLAGGWLVDRVRHPARLLAWTQGGVALTALLGGLAVNAMPGVFLRTLAGFGFDFGGMTATKMLLSALLLLPAALLFGATFPVVVKLAPAAGRGTGSRIGRVYVMNTLGAIFGSFVAGFVLLPTIGMESTLVLVIAIAGALGIGSLVAEPGWKPARAIPAGLALVAIVGIAIFGPRWNRGLLGAGVYFEPQQFVTAAGAPVLDNVVADYELMTYTEGYNETIISYRSPKGKFITVNGSPTASDHFDDMFAQRMLGHLPLALCPKQAKTACIVGLGAGVTAGSIAIYDLESFTALEIETGVFVASRFFEKENHHLLDNPKLKVLIDDGRNFLKVTEEKFDVISSAPNFPSLTGSGALFSTEFFELARARLAPGGVVCHYAPIFRIQPGDVAAILGSFRDVFPHVRVFSTGLWIIVLGRMEPFPPIDVPELTRRVKEPVVAQSLAEIGVRGPIELLSFFQFDEDRLAAITDGAPRNTDDQPRAEFDVPRSLFSSTVGPNLEVLRSHRPSREERADKLGLTGDDRSSFIALAAAYDDATSAQIDLLTGKTRAGLEKLVPVAESGARFARVVAADYFVKRGLKLQHENAPKEAREAFQAALRYDPDSAEALVGVGYLDIFEGNIAEADRFLSRAVELYPRSAGAVYRLGIVRQAQGRAEEAEELYRRALARAPRLGPAHGLLGSLLLGRGDAAGALEQFEIALECGERSPGIIEGREAALRALGRAGSP